MSKDIRACSTCTACCVFLEIQSKSGYSTRLDTGEDLSKGSGTPCKYLSKHQTCSIYSVRPLVCREFMCDWIILRKGYGKEDDPSRIGFIGVRGNKVFTGSTRALESKSQEV